MCNPGTLLVYSGAIENGSIRYNYSFFINRTIYIYKFIICDLAGPAESVRLVRFLTEQFFSQGKSKIPFLQKANNKRSASVILGLIRLIILIIDGKGISSGARLSAAHAFR